MRHSRLPGRRRLSGVFLLLPLAAPVGAQQPDDPRPPAISYDNGIRTRNADGGVELRINGRVMLDFADVADDLAPALEDDEEFRRIRILAQGTVGEHLGFRAQWDFSDRKAEMLELMFDARNLPFGSVRVGHFREPFGLNANTSSAHLTFLERSSPSEAFTFGRNRGVMVHDRFERGSWAVGFFREADETFHDLGENTSVSARVTWLPLWADDGSRFLHLGLGLVQRDTSADGLRLTARPESHLVSPLVDTGRLAADDTRFVGLEAAWVEGSLSMQGEVYAGEIDLAAGNSARLAGGYLQSSWFLTGEHKTYRASKSSMGRIDVHSPFLGGWGRGAWEIAARLAHTDLDDGSVGGGVQDDLTLGLNWHLSSHSRLMLNYILVDVDDSDVDGRILMARLHMGF